MQVSNILSEKGQQVYTIERKASLQAAVNLLSARNIGVVVVMEDDGAVSGILSERDVVHTLSNHADAGNGKLLEHPVSDFMTQKVVSCDAQTQIAEVMNIMTQKRIRHMPVLEENRLIGLVSIGDVVKRKIQETEEEAETLKQYISAG